MKIRHFLAVSTIGLLSAVAWMPVSDAQDQPAGLQMRSTQKEFLTLEPILVTLSLDDKSVPALPVEVGNKSGLRFEIKPPVKPRSGAKPLVAEAKNPSKAKRVFKGPKPTLPDGAVRDY